MLRLNLGRPPIFVADALFYLTFGKKYDILTVGSKEVMNMVVKISSKNQVTIPKDIANIFRLRKGDVLDVIKEGNKIVMIPKEIILKNKYPQEEVPFRSGAEMTRFFKKRIKK